MGIRNNTRPEKYLGVGLELTMAKNANFAELKEIIFKKALNRKGKLLNQEGRGVMIKLVFQAILTHQISCFRLPKKILDDINQLASNMWWGNPANSRKVHWCSWKRLCDNKFHGGYRCRDLTRFNLVLLAKLG